jgi:multiple sugar transport system permease protein
MRYTKKILIYFLLLAGSAMFLLPLLWMMSTGLKPIDQTMAMPPTWLPYRLYVEKDGAETEITRAEAAEYPGAEVIRRVSPRWGNFGKAIKAMKFFPLYLKNTLFLCLLTVIGTVFSSALAAYGFSRIEWKGRNKIFLVALATMMIPFPVVMVPLYCMFRWLGWIGTLRPLWVGSFFAGAFNVFLLRQFFITIPKDLSEAARIDGCSEFRIFWQIIMPLSRPALMVVGLFQFMFTWNDFLGPLIYLTDQKDFTLALGLQFFQSQHGGTEWHYLMAASTIVAIPIIVLFFFTQRSFIEGISMTGLKG